MVLYDSIGQNYSQTRSSDPRIAATLLKILSVPHTSTIADIGAGTGSYALALAKLESGLSRLQKDLETGDWEQNYGYLCLQKQYDVGYRFIYT